MPAWRWWLWSDQGLVARIEIGAAFFFILAAIDLWRNGREATRWREYAFLLVAVALAMAYGFANDFLASGTSWEYFYYGKGLDRQIGLHVPPDMRALRWAACMVGLKATWTAGLIAGVALLIANNPRPGKPPLPYRTLLRLLVLIFLGAATFAAIGAAIGARGWLAWTNSDITGIARENLFRPRRFMCVYGMNLGGYAGGLVATLAAVWWVLRQRSRLGRLSQAIPAELPATERR
jgi:hypothetical protein